MTEIQKKLFSMQDVEYRDFSAALIPNIQKERVIGIRVPALRRLAKEIHNTKAANEFLNTLPHYYLEENSLHAFLIEQIKDYDKAILETERFLPFIDNWATCDSMRPKAFAKNLKQLEVKAIEWTKSSHTYTARFGIEALMCYYLGDAFSLNHPKLIAEIKTDEYYLKMMIAWYFATALAKQYILILPFIENKVLDKWTHDKAIQKAVESNRITDRQKEYLKALKIK